MLIVDTVFHFVLISCQSNSRLSLDGVKTQQQYPYLQANFIHLEWLYKFDCINIEMKNKNMSQKMRLSDYFHYMYSRMAKVDKMTSSLHDLLCQIQ